MHLQIDIREACRPHPAGKGIWTRGFLHELLSRPVDLTLHTDAPLPPEFDAALGRPAKTTIRRPALHGALWHLSTAQAALQQADTSLYVSPTSFVVPYLLGTRMRSLPVIHDLIAFRDDTHLERAARIERWTLPRTLRNAAHVCTISAATRSDLLRQFPTTDPQTVTTIFAGPKEPHPAPTLRDERIILCVGTICPRKNQGRLALAFGRLAPEVRRDWRLVIVGGRGWQDDAILRTIAETPNAEWRSYLPEDELLELYRHASILAFPSLDEGFGLPVLDAFQRGLPVLTSGRGALQELAGGAAFIIDPLDIAAMTHGLAVLMTDRTTADDLASRGRKRAERYTWAHTVDLFLEAASRLL